MPKETLDPRPAANAVQKLLGKLDSIGRRSPKDLHALEVLADLVLDRLGPDLEPAAYHWKCDEPNVTKRGAR